MRFRLWKRRPGQQDTQKRFPTAHGAVDRRYLSVRDSDGLWELVLRTRVLDCVYTTLGIELFGILSGDDELLDGMCRSGELAKLMGFACDVRTMTPQMRCFLSLIVQNK